MPRYLAVLCLLVLAGCGSQPTGTLSENRKGFQTKATGGPAHEPLAQPPGNVFQVVQYDAAPGKLAAYLTPDPQDSKKRPAIVWITGGDCNTIGDVWSPAPAKNDQSAGQYRQAGIVMMYPSLRGGNQNPGQREGLYGEVDDVLAAAEFLSKQPHVDPQRIYLGGHSTGGTLVLLVAASSNRFRAIFSFGPADTVSRYPKEYTPFNTSDAKEVQLRSPIHWMATIQSPTFLFEGDQQGNLPALHALKRASSNPLVQAYPVAGADHFSLLAPVNRLIAGKIVNDTGEKTNLAFTEAEVKGR